MRRILLALIVRCGEVMMAAVVVADSSVRWMVPRRWPSVWRRSAVEVLAEAVNRPVQLGQWRGVSAGADRAGCRVSRLSRWSRGWARRLTMRACSSSWRSARGIRRWWCARSLSGSRRRSMCRRGCSMTPGFPKDGKRSPGVKRQYSGTLGKIGNCQIGVSVHAVGERGDGAVGVGAVSARGVVRGS